MFLLYDLVFMLYALVYLPYLLLTKRGYAGFGMRLGLFSVQVKGQVQSKANIWVHAVSVGEVMLLDGFIDQLRKKYPSYQIIATVTTKTGYALACERLRQKAVVIPSPIDFSFVAGNFVALISPKMYISVETEIWPNLYRKLYQKNIPIMVINGRISDNSYGRYKAIRFLLKNILNQVSVWCMQSQQYADRIIELGADPSRVKVTGNVKFDELPKNVDSSVITFVSNKDEFWWVAGSTHPGEEEIVLDVFNKIVKNDLKWRLAIVPRHIERVPAIMELVNRHGFKAVKFTEIASPPLTPRHEEVLVVDTIGHLRSLYSLASLVFVGKSLCVGGGHNVIEPASYGKAIVVGPRCENFKDIILCFTEANAIIQVDGPHSFEIAVIELCKDKPKRERLGAAALEVIARNQGATKRSLECLEVFLK